MKWLFEQEVLLAAAGAPWAVWSYVIGRSDFDENRYGLLPQSRIH